MEYEIKIDAFEGPLDLLLHLIKESKVDIWDIDVVEIATQYLDYIKKMESLNLDVASEYLVMASELIEMKSRLLLPRVQEEENAEEEDPREVLIKRLIEYQHITERLKELSKERQGFYTKLPESLKEYEEDGVVINSDLGLDDLMRAFEKFLKRKEEEKPLETTVTKKEISVEDRRKSIRNILHNKKKVDFFELFEIVTKEYIVVTFLAILEMARKNELFIRQENNFDSITVEELQ